MVSGWREFQPGSNGQPRYTPFPLKAAQTGRIFQQIKASACLEMSMEGLAKILGGRSPRHLGESECQVSGRQAK